MKKRVVHEEVLTTARRVLAVEERSLADLRGRLGGEFVRAVELLLACKGKVVLTGMGKSGLVCRKIAATLASTGTPAFFLHPGEGSHGDLGMLSRGDLLIAVSNSGEAGEVLLVLPAVKRLGIPIIAMAGSAGSSLAKAADCFLSIAVAEEACPLGLAPTSSTAVTMALGDALAVVLLDLRGFTAEDFALFHPGGVLGRRLLLTVEDAMHAGDGVPRVGEATLVREALFTITGKKLGMTTVQDDSGRLLGIITDGDLRRLMEKVPDPLGRKAGEVMTRSPRTIARDEMATVALRMMEEKSITALVVVDGDKRVQGVVHLHDLLKAGI
jgi:arabinose-5-phosphate isomerase